jgi:hypothetical protein
MLNNYGIFMLCVVPALLGPLVTWTVLPAAKFKLIARFPTTPVFYNMGSNSIVIYILITGQIFGWATMDLSHCLEIFTIFTTISIITLFLAIKYANELCAKEQNLTKE